MMPYSHTHFEQLPDFEAAHRRSPFFQPVLWDLGDLICRHELENIVGVCLLHKHFDLDSSERLTRHYGLGTCEIYPTTSAADLVPTVFSVQSATELAPLEYATLASLPPARAEVQLLVSSLEFVAEVHDLLNASDALEVFGLATLSGIHHLAPASNESVLERNDGSRRLRLDIISLETLRGLDSAQTLWRFSQPGEPGKFACPITRPNERDGIGAHCYHCCGCLNTKFHR